jgi:hypothetical protein
MVIRRLNISFLKKPSTNGGKIPPLSFDREATVLENYLQVQLPYHSHLQKKKENTHVARLIRYSIYHLRIYSPPLKTETKQEKKQHI